MKRLVLITILNYSFLIVNCFAQTYGWVDLSNVLPYASYSDVYAIGNEVWITSASSTELYYNNAGGTTNFTTYTTPAGFLCIHMINSSLGYAGAENGRVFRTTDGGANWTLLLPLTGAAVSSITFPPTGGEPGYCCGEVGRIYSVTSTGTTKMTSNVVSNLSSITFPSTSHGWVCGEDVIRHYTSANGQWNADQSYPGNITCRAVYFIDNNNGWIVGGTGSNGAIIHTTNGTNWASQTDPSPSSGIFNAVFFLYAQEGWAAGNFGRVIYTPDGGDNWSTVSIGATDLLRGIHFTASNNGYIVGDSGDAYKYGELTSVEKEEELPTEFSLLQNYPNPFFAEGGSAYGGNPGTKIKFTISTVERFAESLNKSEQTGNSLYSITLKVYDVLGNEVATLVSEEKPTGEYEVEFSGSELTSGIYFYQLKAGNYIETKKMLLLK